MKKSLLLLSCLGMFYAATACDDGGDDSGGTNSDAGTGGAGTGGSVGTGTGAGGSVGTGVGTGGTGGTSTTGGTSGSGTGGTSSTAGNCSLPAVTGSCVVPVGNNPIGVCQEYYGSVFTAATIKQICDASKGVVSSGSCPKAGLLGYCDVAVNGTRSFNQYYYGAPVAGDPYKVGCMGGGGMWCTN